MGDDGSQKIMGWQGGNGLKWTARAVFKLFRPRTGSTAISNIMTLMLKRYKQ